MKVTTALVPTLALTSLALTGCTSVESSGTASSSTPAAASSAPRSAAAETSTSDAPATQSDSASPSDASSESSSPSSTSSPTTRSTARISESDIIGFASTHETRSCVVTNMAYVSRAQFCKENANSIDASYKDQRLYFTTAVQFKSSVKYTYTVSLGSQSVNGSLDSAKGVNTDGQAVTLTVYVPMRASGTYTVKYFEDGKEFATDSVQVSVKQ